MSTCKKQEIISFKADASLTEAMRGINNRSEFIRSAILAAMDNVCPLCCGSGILTPDQKRHWQQFEKHHDVEECHKCHALHMVCAAERQQSETARPEPSES